MNTYRKNIYTEKKKEKGLHRLFFRVGRVTSKAKRLVVCHSSIGQKNDKERNFINILVHLERRNSSLRGAQAIPREADSEITSPQRDWTCFKIIQECKSISLPQTFTFILYCQLHLGKSRLSSVSVLICILSVIFFPLTSLYYCKYCKDSVSFFSRFLQSLGNEQLNMKRSCRAARLPARAKALFPYPYKFEAINQRTSSRATAL